MTETVKKLFKKAKQDYLFINDLKKVQEEDYAPKWWWGNMHKTAYASVYYGYLVGKGKYQESDYN